MRRTRRDPADSLELGGPVFLTQSIRMKRFSKTKILKYLILIVLGVAIHSIYREIFQAKHHVDEVVLPKEGPSGAKIFHADQEPKKQHPPQESNLKVQTNKEQEEISKKLFDAANRQQEKEKETQQRQSLLREQAEKLLQAQRLKQRLEENRKEQEEAEKRLQKEEEHRLKQDEEEKRLKQLNEKTKEAELHHKIELKKKLESIKIVEGEKDSAAEGKAVQAQLSLQKIADIAEETEKKAAKVKVEELPKEVVLDEAKKIEKVNEMLNKDIPAEFHEAMKKIDEVERKTIIESVKDHDESLPNFATAAIEEHWITLKKLIRSLQLFYKNKQIKVWDINLSTEHRKELEKMCNVDVISFIIEMFPLHFRTVNESHWLPLVLHEALAKFEHVTWVNPMLHLNSESLKDIVSKTNKEGILVIGREEGHSTMAVTNPLMFKYLKINKNKLYETKHIKIMALILHNTDSLRTKFLNPLIACAMEPECMAPPSSKWTHCEFDLEGKKYANCHRYQDSAMNVVLNNWFHGDSSAFFTPNCCFTVTSKQPAYPDNPDLCPPQEEL